MEDVNKFPIPESQEGGVSVSKAGLNKICNCPEFHEGDCPIESLDKDL